MPVVFVNSTVSLFPALSGKKNTGDCKGAGPYKASGASNNSSFSDHTIAILLQPTIAMYDSDLGMVLQSSKADLLADLDRYLQAHKDHEDADATLDTITLEMFGN